MPAMNRYEIKELFIVIVFSEIKYINFMVVIFRSNGYGTFPDTTSRSESRQGGTIFCPRNPLAGTGSARAARGEEEAAAGVERLLGQLVVEGEVLAALLLLTASPACGDVW